MNLIYTLIILLTLAGVAVGRLPSFRMNRATIALIGAVLLIACGSISLEQAYASIDGNTIVLLFSMMVINANLRLCGFFNLVGFRVTRWARTPIQLLLLIVLSSGILSAIFLNDTIVLMMTPLVISITRGLKRDPVPYLIGLMTAANIGSAATLTGNPQNMIIGMASGISYSSFAARLTPAALAGLAVVFGVLVLLYRKEFGAYTFPDVPVLSVRILRPLLYKSSFATAGMLAAFLAGVPIPLASLAAAALLLFTRRVKPKKVFSEIDFTLLVFFIGLFIVTGAVKTTGLSDVLFSYVQGFAVKGAAPLSIVSAVLSNILSNVPTVLLFRPIIPSFPAPEAAWLTLAMSSTFAGNLTLLGSVANLIVAESARKEGIQISFGTYLKAGIPVTVISLILGVLFLSLPL